jgi:AcrR family transcriptional regulator
MSTKDETLRRQIIDQADNLFFEVGFSAVSMDELARRLGRSKKTIYRLFRSKEDLLRGVLLKIIGEVEEKTDGVFNDPALSFVEKLQRIFSLISIYVLKLRQPILEDIRRNAMDVWEEFDAWRQKRVLDKFGGLLRQGMAEGHIRDDLDPQVLAIIHAAVVRRVINPETLGQVPLTAPDAFRTVMTVLFEGILTDEARKSYRRPGGMGIQPVPDHKEERKARD